MMFKDSVKIVIRSGNGGNGHVSFRRELFVPNGGPDGGDGGKGGDIIFEVDKGLNTLNDFRHMRRYFAGNGQEGGKRRCHGKNGEDLVIKVPEGTVIRDEQSGKVITDMSGGNAREVVLTGGRGGQGNMHYVTAVMQAPKYAQAGKPGTEMTVILELKVIADVGLVGFPNAGKSTLLSHVSNATPKIADYPFTTLNPVLGVVGVGEGSSFVMADIPGLIEGASEGQGLGHDFLRHLERTKLLLHVVDAAGTEYRDPVEDVHVINNELMSYGDKLAKLPQIIVANKTDSILTEEGEKDNVQRLREAFEPEYEVFPISAVTGEGVKELMAHVWQILRTMPDETVVFEKEYIPVIDEPDLPYSISRNDAGEYVVEGPLIEKMLGYTNLESEKGFAFFQKFMGERGVYKQLKKEGIQEGDIVRLYGHTFEYLE
jgi:GTP-binding protein